MKRFLTVILFFLGFCGGIQGQTSWPADTIHTAINSNNPRFPFPQFLEYKAGKSLAKYNAEGVTHADMERTMREGYKIMMHRAVYTNQMIGSGTSQIRYIKYNSNENPKVPGDYGGKFCTEGDGYALLAAAYFGDKKTFDGLWCWVHDNRGSKVKKYIDCSNLRPDYRYSVGLAGVYASEATASTSTDANTATDGDVDIAMALLMANMQWGDNMGVNDACGNPISYKTEALKYMKSMVDTIPLWNVNLANYTGHLCGDIGVDGYVKGGDTWDEITNWRYGSGNTVYPWARSRPEAYQVKQLFADYNAPAYFGEFAKFLALNGGTPWQINQYLRAEASGDWIIKQVYDKGYIPITCYGSISDDGSTTSFTNFSDGEDFRLAWRTILNYLWDGNPSTTWNPTSHQVEQVGNTFESDMANRHASFLKYPRKMPSDTTAAFCSTLGSSPDPASPLFKGVVQISQGISQTGSCCIGSSTVNTRTNYAVGTGVPAAVASGDLDLTAELYRQCELLWDDNKGSVELTDYERNEGSTPYYFHDWFRLLGMLTASGNLHPAAEMVPSPNLKVYMSVDKTFAYEGDLVTYTISYRNYGSIAATGVSIVTILDSNYELVSAVGGASGPNSISWTIGSVPGFNSNDGIAPTQGTRTFTVRAKSIQVATNVCLTSTITDSKSSTWTSNEYPNNASYTMERNCVDLLKDRVLSIKKTADRTTMNGNDIVNFKVAFENMSGSNLWLNGGRNNVLMSYGNYIASTSATSFYQFYRIWHSAQEAYIDLGNYRISYFMNDAAAIGLYDAATNPTGWDTFVDNQRDLDKYGYNPKTLPTDKRLKFTYEKMPWGTDSIGSWNQRLVTQFAHVLSAPFSHIFDKIGHMDYIHKGVIGPGFTRTRFESRPSSALQPRLLDDWSYSKSAENGPDRPQDGQTQRFYPVSPTYTNFKTKFSPVPVNIYSKDMCEPNVRNFGKVLVEEFDGYAWRRIAGNGPLPGRETYNVLVVDSIPIELTFNAFTDSNAVEVNASYTPLTGNSKFSGIVRWSVPVMLTGEKGDLAYSAVAKPITCPTPDKNFLSAAWISSSVDSPDSSSVDLKVTCSPVPPTPPKETSLKKTANKAFAEDNDVITYTLTFTNKDGSDAVWSNSATDWQVIGTGTTMPDLTNAYISLDNNKNVTKAGPNGYSFGHKKSHGKNGATEATFNTYSKGTFSLFFRYTGGTPGQSDFKGVRLEISPTNPNVINFKIFNDATSLGSYDNIAYPGIYTSIKIRAQLIDDKLYIWINNLDGAPLKVVTGILPSAAGYAGIYAPNTEQGITAFNTHWDSAFDLVITDPIPAQLTGIANMSDQGISDGTTVTWPAVSGPILAGETIIRTFDATVAVGRCNDFITNIAKASVYGISNIQSQNVVKCGSAPACVPPASISARVSPVVVCLGQTATLGATFTLGNPINGYRYLWRKSGVVVNPSSYSTSYADLTFNGVSAVDTGIYILRINDGTDDVSNCYLETEVKLQLSSATNAPSVIIQSDNPKLCVGDTARFNAIALSAVRPGYTWYVNDVIQIGDTNAMYASDQLKLNDLVKVIVVSRSTCSGSQSVSDTISPIILPIVKPILALKPVSNKVCLDQLVKFEASGTGFTSGTLFTWYQNQVPISISADLEIGINTSTTVYATVTSDLVCARPISVFSDTITVEPQSSVEPMVQITSDRIVLCSSDKASIFTIDNISGVDDNTDYQWLLNGNDISGETNDTLKINTLNDGDSVSLRINSKLSCRNKDYATSRSIGVSISPSVLTSITVSSRVGGLGCEGDTIYLSAVHTPGAVNWSTGAIGDNLSLINWTNRTSITATLNSIEACANSKVKVSDPVTLSGTQRQPLNFDVTLEPDAAAPLCPGDVELIAVTNTEGLTYKWEVGNSVGQDSIFQLVSITSDVAGLLTATKTGCFVEDNGNKTNIIVASKSFSYPIVKPVQVAFSQSEIGLCEGKPANVSVTSTGNVSGYDWFVQGGLVTSSVTNSAVLSNVNEGDIIRVVAKPLYSCPSAPVTLTAEAIAKVSDKPQAGFTYGTGELYFCTGSDTVLVPLETNTSYIYTWLKEGQIVSTQKTGLQVTTEGQYKLVIQNYYCYDTTKVEVRESGISVKASAVPMEFVPGDAVKALALVNNPNNLSIRYFWTPATVLQPINSQQVTFYPLESVFITIEIKTPEGCSASDSVQIRKIDRLFVPNAITPESGNQNAVWDIKGTEAFPELEVKVYNRWGSLIHEQRGYATPWNGTSEGRPVPVGTYYYVLKDRKLPQPKVGDLTIIR